MPAPADPPVARRAVLGAVAGAALLTAGGCGIRLEDDAPRVPLLPTREPVPGEPALLTLLADTAAVADAARTTPGDLAARLADLHGQQLPVLQDALLSRGVPPAEVDRASAVPGLVPAPGTTPATPSRSPTPSAAPTPSPRSTPSAPATTPAQLAVLEGRALTAPGAFSSAPPELRPTLVSLLAQRVAAVALLGGTAPPRAAGPREWSRPAALAPVVTAGRDAAYLLQVAAAQSTGAARARAEQAVRTVHAGVDAQVAAAGPAAPLPPFGVPLPFPVAVGSAALRLERYAVDRLRGAYGAALAGLTGADALPALTAVPWWLGDVEVLCRRAGLALTAFPGLAG